ncbi:MAG: hypothetical protein ACLTSX_08795 [Collinsella sp.]
MLPAHSGRRRARSAIDVHLDLGCGKGAYIAAHGASATPTPCSSAWTASRCASCTQPSSFSTVGLKTRWSFRRVPPTSPRIFAPGELSSISISLPTPHPKRRHARLRVTTAEHLDGYRSLIAEGGMARASHRQPAAV